MSADTTPGSETTVCVAPSLTPLQALLASKRHQREARKWPWAWWCTTCDTPDACGAAKTKQAAQAAADQHIVLRHLRSAPHPAA